jgi:cytochrome bd-type quinol oxidase subunit 2
MPPVGDKLGEGVRSGERDSRPDDAAALRIGAGVMTLAAAAFVGYGVLFLIRNFSDSFLELGIGPGEVDVGKDQIQAFSPSLAHYISHLHLALAGFLAATGVAVGVLAWFGVRRGHVWAFVGAVAAPVIGLAVALPAHYPYNLDTAGHLGLIYVATVVFVAGAVVALTGLLGRRAAG